MAGGYEFTFSVEKDTLLRRERGVSFEQIIALIDAGCLRAVLQHHNTKRYPNQRILEVEFGDIVYVIPCVFEGKKVFLKTIYPSRKAKKRKIKGGKDA